jgi:methionyl-tRNA formyltransferase
VKLLAAEAGIPVYQPPSLRRPESIAPLQKWRPEAIVVAAFGQILRAHVLELPPLGCYNVHASLLPRWRGASPIQHAILAGDEVTGVTLMGMEAGLDTGPIYAQEAMPILPADTAGSLHDRLAVLGGAMLTQYLDDILSGDLTAQRQQEEVATYAPMIQKEMGQIDWGRAASAISRQVRAMTPWPSAYTSWDGLQLKILAAFPHNVRDPKGAQPGNVLTDGETIYVTTGEGGLRLEQMQLAGKRPVDIAAFIRGRPDFVGSRLGDGG